MSNITNSSGAPDFVSPYATMREARVHSTLRGTVILTISGYRMHLIDPKGAECYLDAEADDSQLGHALRSALGLSRLIPLEEAVQLREVKGLTQRYKELDQRINTRFKFKSTKERWRITRLCTVKQKSGSIAVCPHPLEEFANWLDWSEKMAVTVPETCADQELGKAVRAALERCAETPQS